MLNLLAKYLLPIPNVTSMLGVGSYAATKIVDAIFMGASIIKIIALVATCGASISVGLLLFKRLTTSLGKAAAVSW